ncbi:site-2 protease family protein [Georgenia alba]|uniref:Zinc metalloprotease n=1 Tax=Georgenia alba TaxID=2233858 RepID=A0ABW2QGK6_9MICO
MTSPRPRLGTRVRSGWVVGRVGGIPVVLGASWVLIAAVLVLLYFPLVRDLVPGAGLGTVVATTVAFVVMLFVSVLLHELAHGFTALRFGVRPREYVMTFWGGHTSFEQDLGRPGVSALVAIAGPAANAMLALLAWLALETLTITGPGALLVYGALFSNGLVAAFNLLPGLPLDGGHVLEAIVWGVTGDRTRGTVAAAWIGRLVVAGIVVVVLVVPLVQGRRPDLSDVWLLLIAFFLWTGAGEALRAARARRQVASIDLGALAVPAVAVDAGSSLADAAGSAGEGAHVVLVAAGRPVALLDPDAAAQVPAEARAQTPATAVARTLAPQQVVVVTRGAAALEAVAVAQHHGSFVVLLDDGEVRGVVDVAAVARAMRTARP